MAKDIETSLDRGVLSIRFSRPAKKNALTFAMYEAIVAELGAVDDREDVRVVLLSGAGENFTSGNDIADFAGGVPPEPSPGERFLLAIRSLEKPLVAAVDGVAVGVGTTMLLHCDLVYASDRARFQMPFVNLGLCPEGGSSVVLPAIAGRLLAAELLMFGEPFDAQRAREAGLVSHVVPAAELLTVAEGRAAALAEKPAAALRATKRLLRAPRASELEAVMRVENATFRERLGSPEAASAFAAFFARKR